MAKAFSLYDILGVERDATEAHIRKAFRKLTFEHHPDRFSGDARAKAEARFQEITEAFNVLSRPESREKYDADLAQVDAVEGRVGDLRLTEEWLDAVWCSRLTAGVPASSSASRTSSISTPEVRCGSGAAGSVVFEGAGSPAASMRAASLEPSDRAS